MEVHRHALRRRYFAHLCSLASCYFLFALAMLVFVPYFMAYSSHKFWLKEDFFMEQPQVDYDNTAIFEWQGTSDGKPLNVYYSTSSIQNQLFEEYLRIPQLKSLKVDQDRDGRADRYELNVMLPLQNTEQIQSFRALLFFTTTFAERVKVRFATATLLQLQTPVGMGEVTLDGDLVLRQTWPLPINGGIKMLDSQDPLLDVTWGTSANRAEISRVMRMYTSRNVTMRWQELYSVSTPAVARDDSSVAYFNATMVVRVPSQSVWYTPQVSEVLKHAWIQYASMFAVIAVLLYFLNGFVYESQLVSTRVTTDVGLTKKSN